MRHSGQKRAEEGSDLALLDGWYIITPIFWSNELLNMLAASGNLKHFQTSSSKILLCSSKDLRDFDFN